MKKGFTLIELLGVVVVLGLIAVISTPIISNMIKNAREAAFLDTAYALVKASEYKYLDSVVKGNPIELKVYYPKDKDILKAKGKMPDSGGIIMKKTGEISLGLWSDTVGKCVVKNYDEVEVRYDESIIDKEDCMSTETFAEMWDGWVTLTLYYPENSTDRQWRLGNQGEVRTEGSFMWQDYEGSIVIPVSRVEDVWTKYKIGNEEVTIPPAGTVLVDIIPDSYGNELVEQVKVKINYDEAATIKEYKIGNGEWIPYAGEFTVTENCMIEARVKKADNIYDAEGNLVQARNIMGRDAVYIGNIGVKETNIGEPTYVVSAPTIGINPTSLTTSVQVSVSSPANADRVYLKLGNGRYEAYTGPVTVTSNMQVSAYYITYDGEKSNIGYGRVSNIKQNNKPYLSIDAEPYPYAGSYGNSSVTVTLNYSEADTVEYSLDGVVFVPYTNSFSVNKNMRVYGRATNSNGTTTAELDITNIGYMVAPAPRRILTVTITVAPEPTLSTTLIDKVEVKINYDRNATKKYYSLGKYGSLVEYTGEFEVTSNTTIYAYALSDNGKGEASKKIDNISSGISEPNIIGNPNNTVQTSKTNIAIEYDRNATIKRYSVNGGPLRDYAESFDVTTNGEIYAYSQNALGQTSGATYNITNIVPLPPIFVIDMGDYYILKLNYPLNSKDREYKYTTTGTWKSYKEDGILLIKPQYKDELLNSSNELIAEIQNENGEEVDFSGDWYVLEYGITDIKELIFMRWDSTIPPAPQIIPNTLEPAREVDVTILYDSSLVRKQYKLVGSDGKIIKDYGSYSGKIKITKNNTLIYARGKDDAEVWSLEGIYKVTNIDGEQPVIKLTTDLETLTNELGIKVSVTDDVQVSKIKWAKGILGESYFAANGTEIPNDSIVKINENAYYTFYAEDGVGNKQVYTINVENIDLTPPLIEITATPDNTVGLESLVTINFGDSPTKQYKIGNGTVWTNYTAPFTVTSYNVLSNNLQNEDETVTIFAKGKDSLGNDVIISKKLVNLDLDMPASPVITSKSGYPILASYGVIIDPNATITYDTRTDIDNYYSTDNGTTWINYTGSFEMASGTIKAKSVKRTSGLEISVSKTISIPTDAIGPQAYDGDDSTSANNAMYKYMLVDSSMKGKNLRLKASKSGGYPSYLTFLDSSNTSVGSVYIYGSIDTIATVPQTAVKFYFTRGSDGTGPNVYEISMSNEPTFIATNGYMLLHADPTKQINQPYQMVTINYFPTSVQRLYRIGTEGEWLNYQDQPVWVNQGETIYSKGIDQYGNETRIVSSHTANVSDAIKKEAFDNNDSTSTSVLNQYILVDSSMVEKYMRIKLYKSGSWHSHLVFVNSSNSSISSIELFGNVDIILKIPQNTVKFYISNGEDGGANDVYEIQPSNEPTFSSTNGYMLLHADPTQAITSPYQMVTVNYFQTSVQRLYRIGTTGDWLNYTEPVLVNQGETIYAKGIDRYENETRIVSSYTANVSDAISKEACDGNDSTYTNTMYQWIFVDSSMNGRNIRVKAYKGGSEMTYLQFFNSSNQQVGSVGVWQSLDAIVTIPQTAVKFYFKRGDDGYGTDVYEVQPSD